VQEQFLGEQQWLLSYAVLKEIYLTAFLWAKGLTEYYAKCELQLSVAYIHLCTDICIRMRRGAFFQKSLWLGS